jgi:hypothetical protein
MCGYIQLSSLLSTVYQALSSYAARDLEACLEQAEHPSQWFVDLVWLPESS